MKLKAYSDADIAGDVDEATAEIVQDISLAYASTK